MLQQCAIPFEYKKDRRLLLDLKFKKYHAEDIFVKFQKILSNLFEY